MEKKIRIAYYGLFPISDWCQIYCDQHNVHHAAVAGVDTFLITLGMCTTIVKHIHTAVVMFLTLQNA